MKTKDFVEKYKEHFQNDFHKPDQFGYQVYVPEEWLDIIDAGLSSVLGWTKWDDSNISKKAYGDFQIHQIKEKFGDLRFYYSSDFLETDNVINGMVMALEGVIHHLYGVGSKRDE